MKNFTKFKIGDKVVYFGVSVSCESERERYEKGLCPTVNEERQMVVGEKYIVVAINDSDYGFFMDVQGKGKNGDNICIHGISGSNFSKNNNKTSMKITNLVKKILDNDTRTLVKAGFINGDLALTEEGITELIGIIFLEKKSELVKIAEEKNAETNR